MQGDSAELEQAEPPKAMRVEEPPSLPRGGYQYWAPEQEVGHGLTPDSPRQKEATNREQQVPTPSSSHVYRWQDRGDPMPLPAPREFRGRGHTLDVATVPEQDSRLLPDAYAALPPPHPTQDFSGVMNLSVDPPRKPARRGPVYSPYAVDQWMGPGPYRPVGYAAYPTDYSAQGAAAPPHAGVSDWSQYSLFPYSCW
ncbi:hypothetical protein FKM82_027650 [Ascaphus truei]